jgi:hypothetical protein
MFIMLISSGFLKKYCVIRSLKGYQPDGPALLLATATGSTELGVAQGFAQGTRRLAAGKSVREAWIAMADIVVQSFWLFVSSVENLWGRLGPHATSIPLLESTEV